MRITELSVKLAPGNTYALVWLSCPISKRVRLAAVELAPGPATADLTPATLRDAVRWVLMPRGAMPDGLGRRVELLNVIERMRTMWTSVSHYSPYIPESAVRVEDKHHPEHWELLSPPIELEMARSEIRSALYQWHSSYRHGIWLCDYHKRGLQPDAVEWIKGTVDYFPLRVENGNVFPVKKQVTAA